MVRSWSESELACLRSAAESQIQLKVMANALGRTVSSINKVLARQGIRPQGSRPGRRKGDASELNQVVRIQRDTEVMEGLVRKFLGADFNPIKEAPQNKTNLLKVLRDKDRAARRRQRRLRGDGSHIRVPLEVVSIWANMEGLGFERFDRVPDTPEYLVGQKIFSQGKLVMAINQKRMEKGLKSFAIEEFCWD